MKRTIRQRLWSSDDKADARSVGENMRDIAARVGAQASARTVTISDQFYTDQGLVFSAPTRPLGVVNIYSETVDGTVLTSPLSGMSFDRGVCTVKFSALTPGTRYTTIRLSVIG